MDLCRAIVTLSILTMTVVITQETCGKNSPCIKTADCPFFVNLLKGKPSAYLRKLFENLKCGFEAFDEKVCCPSKFDSVSLGRILLPNNTVCGVQSNDRIVGGSATELDEHPWLTLIRYDKPKGWGFYCAGVLISSRYVLTAAHCANSSGLPLTWKLSQVRLGEWNISSSRDCIQNDCSPNVVDVKVEKIILHEDYNKLDVHQQNDIALLKLESDIPFTDFIKPICLPLTDDQRTSEFFGYDMEVAGWGKRKKVSYYYYVQSMSEIKLKVRLPVVNRSKCSSVYSKASQIITDKQLCAGGIKGEDSCRGDSGGPLMAQMPTAPNWIVAGVVSYGPSPCGISDWPGVYTRVGHYVDWILSNIN